MKYVVVPDKSKDHEHANYADKDGKFYIIREETSTKASGNVLITSDISAYTELPEIVAARAENLQQAKEDAIKKLEGKLDVKLKSGVAVAQAGMAAVDAGLVLPADHLDRIAFTQGLTMLNAAESLAPDAAVFNELKLSQVFGRGVVDVQNNVHDMTTSQFKQLVLTYGATIGAMQGELLVQTSKVNEATTIEDVHKLVPKDKKNKKDK